MSDKKKKENQIFSNLEFKKKTFYLDDAKPLFSKDGSSLYIFSENVCHLYSTTTGNYIKKLFSCSSKIISYHLHPLDENFLVTITENGEVTVYNLKENKIEHITSLCINKTLLCSLKIQKFSSQLDEYCEFDWNSTNLENLSNRKFMYAVVKPFQGDSGNLLVWASWCLNDETEAHISVFSYQNGSHFKDFAFKQCKLKKCSNNFVLSNSQEHDVFIGISEHCLNVAHFPNKDSYYYSIRKHYTGLNNTVTCVAFHPTDYCFATGDSIGRIIIWKNIFEQYPLKEIFHWHTLAVNDLIFSKLGNNIFSGGEENVLVKWSLSTQKKRFLPRLSSALISLSEASDASLLSVLTSDGKILILDFNFNIVSVIQNFSVVNSSNSSKNLNILSFDPRSNSIVLNGKTGHIQFLSLKDFNKLNYTFDVTNRNYVTPHTSCSVANTEVNHAIFSPKGDWMITAESRIEKDCYESFLKFWNYVPENGSYKLNTNVEFPHGGVEIYSLEISSSCIVGSTGPDKRFCLWAIEEQINGNVIKEIWSLFNDRKYRNFSSYALDFSKDSSLVAVTFGSVVTIWETDSCVLKCSLSCPNNKNDLKACKFGNNEFTHLIIAGSEFNVCCWNSLTLSMVWTVPFNLNILASDPIGNNMVLFSKKVVVIFSPSSPTSLYLKNYNLESPVIAAKILPDSNGKFSVLILTENYELHRLEHVDTDPLLLKNNQDPSNLSSTPYSSQIPQIQNNSELSSKKLISVLKNKRETVSQLLDSPAHTLSNPSLLCSHVLKGLLFFSLDKPYLSRLSKIKKNNSFKKFSEIGKTDREIIESDLLNVKYRLNWSLRDIHYHSENSWSPDLVGVCRSIDTVSSSSANGSSIRHKKSRTNIFRSLNHDGAFEHSSKLIKDNVGTFQLPVKSFLNATYNNSQNISVVFNDDVTTINELENNFIKTESHTDNLNKMKGNENNEISDDKLPFEIDIVTKFLRIVETQHLLGENCTAGTDLNLGEGVVDRYAQERFRVEADVAVNRANMLTRLWKYADPDVLSSEYLLHASVVGMVEFDDDIFAGGNCYDEYQYKDYWLFCPYAFRLPDGPILTKNLAIEYKYITNSSEWFFIARKSAERIIKNHDQLKKGFIAFTYNDTAHKSWMPDEILSVRYEDGKWSKPYYDCGGGNIWMLTYTVPFFGYKNGSYYFMGTSGIDIDLRRVDIDQCPSPPGNAALNIFAGSHKCKKKTTRCEPISGLGFRRGSYKCLCKRGFYHPDTKSEHKYYNGTVVEDEYEKFVMGEENLYEKSNFFECLPCAEGCDFCVDKRPCIASLNWVMRTIILVLSCMIILCLPAILVFTWKYGNVKVVRAASPVLLRFIILGAFFMYCTPIVMYPTPNLGTCTLRVWLREIGFSLTYGALMLKTWRISVIFHVRSAKPVRITDFDLLKRLGMIVGIFCLFLIVRTLVAPPFVITGRTAEDLKAYLCRTDWWDHSFTSLEVLFLIWGIRLCIVVRKAPSEFNESRFISMAIYNEFLLTVFLKVSMLFLRKPANPDLLYIIFFCYTQLTVTLLLCLIFGSKMYIVFRGQGKLEESSSTFSKPQTTTFLVKPKSLSSQQNPSIDSTAVTKQVLSDECEVQEEFLKICIQLESIKKTYIKLGNKNFVAKIAAMQEIARKDFSKISSELKMNSGDNNSESVKEEDNNGKNDDRKNKSGANCEKVIVHGKSKLNSKQKPHCRACGGKVRKPNEDSSGSHTHKKECNLCDKINNHHGGTDEKLDNYGKEYCTTNIDRLHSGHAKTHSIVINLDDNSRFTDEVTV